MAIANSYPMGTPKSSDLLLGTSVPNPNTDEKATTRNFSLSQVGSLINAGFVGGYTVYTALITQAGTDAPTIDALVQNTTGGVPVWAYASSGVYTLTFPFTLDSNKVVVFVNNGNISPTQNVGWDASGGSGQIRFNTQNNDNLAKGSLEIRIYA